METGYCHLIGQVFITERRVETQLNGVGVLYILFIQVVAPQYPLSGSSGCIQSDGTQWLVLRSCRNNESISYSLGLSLSSYQQSHWRAWALFGKPHRQTVALFRESLEKHGLAHLLPPSSLSWLSTFQGSEGWATACCQ